MDTSVSLAFSASGDSLGHNVRYIVDWADGTAPTTGYVASGGSVSAAHTWSTNGVYNVTAYAQCMASNRSSWSDPYPVANGTNPTLTIDAWDIFYGWEYYVPVYVDGQLLPTDTPTSCPVSTGWHTVSVMDQYYTYVMFVEFSDGYNNGDGRPIYSNTMLTAYYRSP